jgi:2-oxoisovalerate dehydrogenase E1 component beta subunit
MTDAPLLPAAAVHRVLAAAMERGEEIVVLTEGEGSWADALAARFPDRVRALPVSDRATAAVAVGLALGGRRPVVELSSTGRAHALAEVWADAVAVAGAGAFAVPVLWRVPYGGEAGDRVDAPVLDLLASLGVCTLIARDAARAAELTRLALTRTGPVVLLEPRALGRERGEASEAVGAGVCEAVREGSHLTLVAWGEGVGVCEQVAERAEAEGFSVEVVDLVSLWPLDVQGLAARVQLTGRVVVAASGGDEAYARRVLQAATEGAFLYLEAPPVVCAANEPALSRAVRASITY